MRNIREHEWGYQIYIKRGRTELQPCFSIREWGSRKRALKAAVSRRDQLLASLPPRRNVANEQPSSNKTTTGVRGVSRRVLYDPRRDARYLRYEAFWREGGANRSRTFSVGRVESVTPDDELHAYRTAVRFRQLYLLCVERGARFNPDWFDGWGNSRLYERPLEQHYRQVIRSEPDRTAAPGA